MSKWGRTLALHALLLADRDGAASKVHIRAWARSISLRLAPPTPAECDIPVARFLPWLGIGDALQEVTLDAGSA